MYSQRDFILYILSSALLCFALISLILKMFFLGRKQQYVFSKEVDLIRSSYEKELYNSQVEIQEATLQHVSLELHDNVGHFLSLAKLYLTTFKTPLPEEIGKKVEASVGLIARSMNEIRNISTGMNAENIRHNGFIKSAQQLVDQLNKFAQLRVCFTITGPSRYFDDFKEIILYRIMQESLNNIVKHSRADIVKINLHYNEEQLLLSINDNGIGFTVEPLMYDPAKNSSGLRNIIKRSSLINATPEILSWPDRGTTINIIMPY